MSDHTIQTWSNLSSIERCNCGQWSSTVRERWSSSRLCVADHPRRQLADSLVRVARMPVCSLCRYQALLQEAPRHLAHAAPRGGLTDQLYVAQRVNTRTGFRSRCVFATRSTVKSYDQKWLKLESFTVQVQDDAGAPRMSALPPSSQTVVAYLGFLLESDTISAKSLQTYLCAINAVHNDFEYPPLSCGHLVKLVRKGFAELQGSSMLQPQQVTVFPAEHMVTIVHFGLRPNASKHHIRVCACLAAQFASSVVLIQVSS